MINILNKKNINKNFILVSFILILNFARINSQGFKLCEHNETRLLLIDNGYDNLTISIDRDIPENFDLITSLQQLLTSTSSSIYRLTRNRAYIRSVRILIPDTWGPVPEVFGESSVIEGTSQNEDDAQIRVKNTTPRPSQETDGSWKLGDNFAYVNQPYVIKTTPCGFPGSYMKLSPEFVLFGELIKNDMGPAGKILSSEWAIFRWGVYDEKPRPGADSEFYISTDLSTQATKCSAAIPGTIVDSFNKDEICPLSEDDILYDRSCTFLPSTEELSESYGSVLYSSNLTYVDTFCDDEGTVPDEQVHNDEAPTSQNLHCGGRSIWNVMRSHPDFANGNNQPVNIAKTTAELVDDLPVPPSFTIVQNMDRRVVLVLDTSNSMLKYNRLHLLRQATGHYIDTIPLKTFVGIVCFSTRAVTKSNLIEITNDDVRELLKQRLTPLTSAGTSIGSGIRAGLNILATSGPVSLRGSGGSIIILTDGLEHNRPKINETIEEVIASGVRINTIAFGSKVAPALEELAQVSGGSTHAASSGEFGVNSELQEAFLSYNQNSDVGTIPLVSERVLVPINSTEEQSFLVDQSVGTNTRATLFYDTDAKPIITLISPDGITYTEDEETEIIYFTSDEEFKTISIRIVGQAQLGVWRLTLENPTFNSAMEIRVSVVTYRSEMEPLIISPALLCRSFVYTGTEAMVIYSDVYQGDLAVLDAYVAALITRPLTEGGIVDTSLIELRDDGLDPDVIANDGVYSAYFISFTSRGRYSVKVVANDNSRRARIHPRFILGIGRQQSEPIVYDTRYLATNFTRNPGRTRRQIFEGSFLPAFQRVSSGAGAFTVQQFIADDNCSPGYTHFQDSCYKLHSEPQIAEDTAQLVCENEGGQLAVVNSRQELSWIVARVTPVGKPGNVWFGGVAQELRSGGADDIEQVITRIRRGMQDDDLNDLTAIFQNDLLTEEMEYAVDSFSPYIDGMTEQEIRRLIFRLGLETRGDLEKLKQYSQQNQQNNGNSRKKRQLSPGSIDLQSFLAFGQPIILVDPTTTPDTTTSPELVMKDTTFYTTSYFYINGTMTYGNSTDNDVTLSPAKKEPEVPDPRSSGADIPTCSWFQSEKIIESTGDVCSTNKKFICEKGLRDRFPPSRIIDLQGRMDRENNLLRLTFSAPGDDLNIGSAKGYEIRTLRTRKARSILKNNFELGEILNDAAVVQGSINDPLPSGMEETIVVNLTMNSECPSHASVDLIFGLPDDIFMNSDSNQLTTEQNEKQADILELVSGLISNFVLSPFEMQVAVFCYPSNYSLINFSEKLSNGADIFEQLITAVIPVSVENRTVEDTIAAMNSNGGRSDVAKVMIAFTNDNFEQFSNISQVTTMLVAVGEEIDIASIWNASSYPGCNNSFIVNNSPDLGGLVEPISYQICEARESEYQAVGVRAFDEEGQNGAVSNIVPLVSTHIRTPVTCPIIEPPPTPAPLATSNLAQTVGLSVGIPVVLILCILGAVMLFGQVKKWKKKRAEKKEKEERRLQMEKNKAARQVAMANAMQEETASSNNNNSSQISVFNLFNRKIQPINNPPV